MNVDWGWVERWRGYFRDWYEVGGVEEKVAEASRLACRHLDDGMISVSGGKDSMAVLHIIVNSCGRKDVNVFHLDYAHLMPREVEREVLENIRSVAPQANLIVKRYQRPPGVYAAERTEVYAAVSNLGFLYHLLGIRADESSKRRARGRVADRGRWVVVHPIYDFTWRDVWAYVFEHRVPVPETYFAYAKLVGWDKVRFVTFFDKRFERYGSPQLDGVLAWRLREL